MSQGAKYSKVDRVIELFTENMLYSTFSKPVALLIELILRTGATPIDVVNIQPEHLNRATKQLTLHIHKEKHIIPTTHSFSQKGIEAFFSLKKPLHTYSIRRLQQLLKKETQQVGSTLTTPRALRKAYLSSLSNINEFTSEKTQLTSLKTRTLLSKQDQKKLSQENYFPRYKQLILTLLQSGLRVSEVLLLQPRHIQKNTLLISADISYNQVAREIPLPFILKKQLALSTQKYLFSKKKPLTQRRFEQICKEVKSELHITELSPSILRATAIFNLSKTLSEDELLSQSGLGTSTMYTHGFLTTTEDSTTITTPLVDEDLSVRKDSDSNDANESMYHRSKLRDGGDSDE